MQAPHRNAGREPFHVGEGDARGGVALEARGALGAAYDAHGDPGIMIECGFDPPAQLRAAGSIARRHGEEWFIGVMNSRKARTLDLDSDAALGTPEQVYDKVTAFNDLVGNVGGVTNATNAGYVGSSTDSGHPSSENPNFAVIQATGAIDAGLGLGFDNTYVGDRGWGFRALAGVAFSKRPDVNLTASGGTLSNDPSFQARLRAEEAEARDDAKDFKYFPVVQVGLTRRF